jgi:hypothetical protein
VESGMEEPNSQLINMIQKMEKKMLQLNEKMDQNRKDLKDVADHLSDIIVEETIKNPQERAREQLQEPHHLSLGWEHRQ